MAFNFSGKSDWQSGTKYQTADFDDMCFMLLDDLGLAATFMDNCNPRLAGWIDAPHTGVIAVDSSGGRYYLNTSSPYVNNYCITRRSMAGLFDLCWWATSIQVLNVSATGNQYWSPTLMCFYKDVNNWARVRAKRVTGITYQLIFEYMIGGTIYTASSGPQYSSSDWVVIAVHPDYYSGITELAFYSKVEDPAPGGWSYLGSGYWNGEVPPTNWILGAGGYSGPGYPNQYLMNDLNNTLDIDVSRHTKFTKYQSFETGHWTSPLIAPSGTNKRLYRLDLSHVMGEPGAGVSKIELMDSSDVVFSTWTGLLSDPSGADFTLYEDDFVGEFGYTEENYYKIRVTFSRPSESPSYFATLTGIEGSDREAVTANESLSFADDTIREFEATIDEDLSLGDEPTPGNIETAMEDSLGLSDKYDAEFGAIESETLGFSESVVENEVINPTEELAFSDSIEGYRDITANENLLISDKQASELETEPGEPLALSDEHRSDLVANPGEPLTISDAQAAEIFTTLEEAFAITDEVFYSALSKAGIKGYITTTLDITNADFCELIQESGHIVLKVVGPDSFGFQAYLFQKQNRQLFNFGVTVFPGDAVMFFCPDQEIELAVGDLLFHNDMYWEILEIREKLYGPNHIYNKAALRLVRESITNLPAPENLVSSINDDGSVVLTWTPIDEDVYPAFSEYLVYISENGIDFTPYRQTSTPQLSVTNLTPLQTYYFKVAVLTVTGDEGPQSDSADCGLPAISLPMVEHIKVGDNKTGSVELSWSPVDPELYPTIDHYNIYVDGFESFCKQDGLYTNGEIVGLLDPGTYGSPLLTAYSKTGTYLAIVSSVGSLQHISIFKRKENDGSGSVKYLFAYRIQFSSTKVNAIDFSYWSAYSLDILAVACDDFLLCYRVTDSSMNGMSVTDNTVGGKQLSCKWLNDDHLYVGTETAPFFKSYYPSNLYYLYRDSLTFTAGSDPDSPVIDIATPTWGSTSNRVAALMSPVITPGTGIKVWAYERSGNNLGQIIVQNNTFLYCYGISMTFNGENIVACGTPGFDAKGSKLWNYGSGYYAPATVSYTSSGDNVDIEAGSLGKMYVMGKNSGTFNTPLKLISGNILRNMVYAPLSSTVRNLSVSTRNEVAFVTVSTPYIQTTQYGITVLGDVTHLLRAGDLITISGAGTYQIDSFLYASGVTAITFSAPPFNWVSESTKAIVAGFLAGSTASQTITIPNLYPDREYNFYIEAVDIYGRVTNFKNIIQCNADENKNIDLTVLNCRAEGGSGKIDADWDEVQSLYEPYFDYYEVWYRLGSGTWNLAHETTSPSATISGLAAGTYSVMVRAIDKDRNYGDFSNTVTGIVVT